MEEIEYVVLWSDSPSGKISLRTYNDGAPVTFTHPEIPYEIPRLYVAEEVFPVLLRKDGTKIAVPYNNLEHLFGWNV